MKRLTKSRTLFMTVCFVTIGIFLAGIQAMAINNTDPRLTYKIISNTDNPTISRGRSFEADFTFTDYSKVLSNKITVWVSSPNNSIANLPTDSTTVEKSDKDDGDGNPIYVLNIPEKNMRYVGKGSAIIKFKIKNEKDDKLYYIQKTITECQPTETSSGTAQSDISLQSYHLDRSGIKEGERFNLILTLKNNSDVPNNHVTIVMDGLNPDDITMDGQLDTKTIETINAGETSTITLPMICNPKMASKNYMIKVQITSDESPTPANYNTFIPVTGTKSTTESGSTSPNASKPLLIIESYDYGGKPVMGGKEFNLAMRFKNTNTATQIENLKITVSSVAGTDDKSVAGAFTPAKSSNTFFVPKVAPGGTFSETIALLPKSDALPNSYGVSVAFNYEAVLDGKREAVEATETISIPLTQTDRFEANDAEIQGPISLGDSGQLSINYVNKGKSKIFNLSVTLEGNFTTGETNTYIGNVESGAGDTFQATLNPTDEGTMSGKATFSYEDANGNIKKVVKDFSCEVMTAQDPGEGGSSEPEAPQKAGNLPPLWVMLTGGGVVVVIIAALIIIHKKRKAKKLKLLEESDDYDDAV